jgi:uncharacterized protein YjbI with pentapeptide repeats
MLYQARTISMRRLAILICASAGWFTLPALACSCLPSDPDGHLAAASLVFRGTVLSIKEASPQAPLSAGAGSVTLRAPQSGMRAKFKIAAVSKGPVQDEVEVGYTASDGANCGWRFSVGDTVTVFASGNRKVGFSTGMCMMASLGSHADRDTNRYAVAVDLYRNRRDFFAAELQKNGADERVLRDQAAFFARYKDFDEADAAFSRLLQVKPHDVAAQLGRGWLRYEDARYEEALSDFRAAVAVDSGNADARRGRTLALVKLGRVQELGADGRDFSGLVSGYAQPSFARADLVGAKFQGAKLNGLDFSGADLRGANFTGANMHTCNFSGANLAGAKFDDLKGASYTTFQQAELQNSSFKGAYLFNANFEGAVLDKADFSKSRLESASLEKASILNANFKGASFLLARLRGTSWEGQDLSGVELRGADLRDTTFRKTSLRGAVFGHSYGSENILDMRGADLSGADMTDAKWGPALVDCRTKLPSGLDIKNLPVLPLWSGCAGQPPKTALQAGYAFQRGPRLTKVDAPKSQLSGVDLSGFGFWQVGFDGSDFSRSNLVAADIQGGSYLETNFHSANLNMAWIWNVSFKGSSFEHANLSGARLYAVDLSGARLEHITLTDACYDIKTVWPERFDPAAAGATVCR